MGRLGESSDYNASLTLSEGMKERKKIEWKYLIPKCSSKEGCLGFLTGVWHLSGMGLP